MSFLRPSQIIVLMVCLNIGVGFFFLVRFLLTDLESQTMQATEEVMVDSSIRLAQVVEHHLKEGGDLTPDLCSALFPTTGVRLDRDIQIYQMSKNEVGLFHYITNANGEVIFDSNNNLRLGQSMARFNDVYKTLRGEYGARSTRENSSDKLSSIMYVGAPIRQDEKLVGVLTAYKAQSDVFPFITARKRQIITTCVLMGAGLMMLVAGVFFWVYRPIGRLTMYAREVIDGGRPAFPPLGRGREVNTLGTALRKMRETLEGREYTKNYVQTLSHELKSPISAIKASAELLQEDMPDTQRSRFLKAISTEVDRSEKVISRLQQLSLMEGMSQLERTEKVELRAVWESLLHEYAPIAKQKDLTIVADLAREDYVGDSFLLRAAFQNLIDNALKFAPEHTEVQVSLERSGNDVIVRVSNGGEPIPGYARKRIYERLFSLNNNDQGKGSGIGLALVKEAVELHQGEVTYDYVKGMNTFTIILNAF